jgi:Flp pilus assembly protein TadG
MPVKVRGRRADTPRVGCRGGYRRERGAALVEFALVAPVLAMLGFGVVDLGRGYALGERARAAAREAAFYAASHPGQLHNVASTACADPANATWRGTNAGAGSFTFTFSPDLANPATDCDPSPMPAGLGPGQPLKVTARANLTLLTPLVSMVVGNPVAVSATVCVDVAGPPSTVPCS